VDFLKGWIFNDTIPATRAAPQGGQAAIAAMQPSPNRDGVARALAKFARTPSIDFARRANHPTACPAPLAKIFWFTFDPNHLFIFAIPAQHRGAFRDRHERRAGMRWHQGRMVLFADGEVVWS
jgi:hypothetical protein